MAVDKVSVHLHRQLLLVHILLKDSCSQNHVDLKMGGNI